MLVVYLLEKRTFFFLLRTRKQKLNLITRDPINEVISKRGLVKRETKSTPKNYYNLFVSEIKTKSILF